MTILYIYISYRFIYILCIDIYIDMYVYIYMHIYIYTQMFIEPGKPVPIAGVLHQDFNYAVYFRSKARASTAFST